MIGLDTNLVVRLLVEDDKRQLRQTKRLLARCHEDGEKCLLTTIVLCELEWVLRQSYGVPRMEVAAAVEGFLTDELFAVEEPEEARRALTSYREGKGDLSDYLLGARGTSLQARTVYTFDRGLRDCEDFTLLT